MSVVPTDDRPLAALADALRSFAEERDRALAEARRALGLSDVDARALLYIGMHPGLRPGELGVWLGISSAGITTLTDRLVQRQVIRRDADPSDRRVVRLSATVDLAAEPWSVLSAFDTALRDATVDETPERIAAFAALLDRLVDDWVGAHPIG